jgi:3-dehydrosphinganine reductase
MKDLDGRNVVVTGGSYGIGKDLVKALLEEGANVFPIARNKDKLDATVEELRPFARSGRTVKGYPGDVSDRAVITVVIDSIASEQGGIDVLVNNAGIVIPGYFEELDPDDFETVVKTNYLGAVYATKAALPHLLKHPESAITITSSAAGVMGTFGYSTYSPTKSALIGFAEVLRAELRYKGVQVMVLLPMDTDTPGYVEEKRVRPTECDAVSGSGGTQSTAYVAKCFIKAFKKGRFLAPCGFTGKLFYRMAGIMPGLTDYILKRPVDKVRKTG